MEGSVDKDAEPRPARFAVKRVAARLLLLTGTLLFLAVSLELATRLLTDTTPPLKISDPVLGNRYVCSYEAMVFHPEVGRKVRLRFNSVGFRGPDRPFDKPAGVRRIAVLGDSMVAALEMEEPDTLVAQLERMLNEFQSGIRWEVLNFGLSGSSPADQLVLYRELVHRFQPDIVLGSYFCGNDLTDSTTKLSNNPRVYFDLDEEGRLYELPRSQVRQGLSSLLNHYSRFYVWQKEAMRGLRAQIHRHTASGSSMGDWAPFFAAEDPDLTHAWNVGAAVVREFARQVEANGSRFVLLVIPSAKQVYPDHFQEVVQASGRPAEQFDQELPEKRLAGICQEAGIAYIPLAEALRAAAPSASVEVEEEWLFNSGRLHWNQRGNRVAAEAIFHYLTEEKEEGVIAGKPSSLEEGRQ